MGGFKPEQRYDVLKPEYKVGGQPGALDYKEPLRPVPHEQLFQPQSFHVKTEPEYTDYPTDRQTYAERQAYGDRQAYTDRHSYPRSDYCEESITENRMYSHESLARISHTQDQLAKYNSESLSRLANGLSGGDGLGRLSGGESLSRLSQAQDSLARISNMTNSISPPQSSSHSSLSPGNQIKN